MIKNWLNNNPSATFFALVFLLSRPVPCMAADKLEITFSPASPVINLQTTTQVDGTTVYDHSSFSVKLKNRHSRPITIHSVNFVSIGDVERSGLGDITHYWPWKGSRVLDARRSISFDKIWGFTVDTPNTTMKYRFEVTYSVEGRSEYDQIVKELVLTPN